MADWSREHGFVPAAPEKTNGKKVAVIGSGPAGLTCAGAVSYTHLDQYTTKTMTRKQSIKKHTELQESIVTVPGWALLEAKVP